MSGRDHEDQLGAVGERGAVGVQHGPFLARVSAPGDPHALARGEAEQAAPEIDRARRVDGGRVNLDVAGDDDALRLGAERDDPPRVLVGLHGEDADIGEDRRHEAPYQTVAAIRSIGDPPVGDHHRHAA